MLGWPAQSKGVPEPGLPFEACGRAGLAFLLPRISQARPAPIAVLAARCGGEPANAQVRTIHRRAPARRLVFGRNGEVGFGVARGVRPGTGPLVALALATLLAVGCAPAARPAPRRRAVAWVNRPAPAYVPPLPAR